MAQQVEVGEEQAQGLDGVQVAGAVTADEARRVLAQARQERAARCWQEIQAAVDRYGCELAAVPQLEADGRIGAVLRVRAVDGEG